jgi:hypothetical protein
MQLEESVPYHSLYSITITWAPRALALVGTSSQISTGDNLINYNAMACHELIASHFPLARNSAHSNSVTQANFPISTFGIYFLIPISLLVSIYSMQQKPVIERL